MRQVRGVTGWCVLLALVFAAAGCATTLDSEQMPGEYVQYVRGGTEGVLHADPQRIIEAAGAVMVQMQMEMQDPQVDENDVLTLVGNTATGERVRITATPYEDGTTLLRVRLGTFGDQQLSNELYRRIASRAEQG